MAFLNPNQALGDMVPLNLTNSKHLGPGGKPAELEGDSFGTVLGKIVTSGIDQVNSLQQESFALNQAFITDPDSVDSHDVTIAMQKANMALQITKAVVDGALQSYREIINLR